MRIFALLYWHALRRGEELELKPLDIFDARTGARRHLLTAGVALLSILIAPILPRRADFVYFVLGPLHAAFGFARSKVRERVQAA